MRNDKKFAIVVVIGWIAIWSPHLWQAQSIETYVFSAFMPTVMLLCGAWMVQ